MKRFEIFMDILDDIMNAPEYEEFLPMLLNALCIGSMYGLLFGLYEHYVHHSNFWFACLFMSGGVAVFRLLIWAILLGTKKVKKIKKVKEEK